MKMKGRHNKYLVMASLLCICALMAGWTWKKTTKQPIHIAALNGPTGIGMAKLINDGNSDYDIKLYQSADEITGKLISGEIDIACVPSNLGAVLYNKTQGEIQLIGINTLGVLYIVENGQSIKKLTDLKGKTILSSGKGGTPEFVLNHILETNGLDKDKDVKVEYLANHADIASQLIAKENTIALLPQPFVTTVTQKSNKIRVAIDINGEWAKAEKTDLPTGIIVVRKAFASSKKKELTTFVTDYKKSVEFVNANLDEAAKLISKFGIVPDEKIAKLAIPKCNIVFKNTNESKEALSKFFDILYKGEPKSVGGKIPDDAFYLQNQ